MYLCYKITIGISFDTARFRQDETRNARRNASRNPQWSNSYLFSNEPFEERPGMTLEGFDLHSDDHFESHLLGNGLYSCYFSTLELRWIWVATISRLLKIIGLFCRVSSLL